MPRKICFKKICIAAEFISWRATTPSIEEWLLVAYAWRERERGALKESVLI